MNQLEERHGHVTFVTSSDIRCHNLAGAGAFFRKARVSEQDSEYMYLIHATKPNDLRRRPLAVEPLGSQCHLECQFGKETSAEGYRSSTSPCRHQSRAGGTFWYIFDPVFARGANPMDEKHRPRLRRQPKLAIFDLPAAIFGPAQCRRENECGDGRGSVVQGEFCATGVAQVGWVLRPSWGPLRSPFSAAKVADFCNTPVAKLRAARRSAAAQRRPFSPAASSRIGISSVLLESTFA